MSSSCHHRPSCPSCPANATNAPSVGGRVCLYAHTHTQRFTHIPVRPAGTAWPVAARPHHRKRHAVLPQSLQPAKRTASVRWAGQSECACVWECIVTRWTSLFLTNRGRCSSKYQNSCAYSDASSFSSPLQQKKRCQCTLCHCRCMQTHRHVPVVGCEYNVCHHVRLVKEVIPRQLQHRGAGEEACEWAVHCHQQWHPAHLSRSFVGSHGT